MSDKYVLVTGGNGTIGSHVCQHLALHGQKPIVGYCNNRQNAVRTAKLCGGVTIELDLGSERIVVDAAAKICSEYSNLSGVIFVGSPPLTVSPFKNISTVHIKSHLNANVLGPFLLISRLMTEVFIPRKNGAITAVLTKAIEDQQSSALRQMGAYSIGKNALRSLIELVQVEYQWLNVSYIYPGFTDTKMLEAFDTRFIEHLRLSGQLSSPEKIGKNIAMNYLQSLEKK